MSDTWLNGWRRDGSTILVGTMVLCAGCGREHGLACVAFDGTPLPDKSPDWPFPEDDCPICKLESRVSDIENGQNEDKLTQRMERLQKIRNNTQEKL